MGAGLAVPNRSYLKSLRQVRSKCRERMVCCLPEKGTNVANFLISVNMKRQYVNESSILKGKAMKFHRYLAILTAAALASGASAATITASNGGQVIATPATIGEDDPTNRVIQAFNEGSSILLAADLAIDGGVIAAGTYVDSHMIFLNTAGGLDVTATGSFNFSAEILGFMSSQSGTNLFTSDSILNGPVTYVAGGYGNNRGLENNDNADFYTQNGMFDVDVGMHVTEPGDWMRVVTVAAVPVPAALPLLLAGLGAFGFVGRRKRRAA